VRKRQYFSVFGLNLVRAFNQICNQQYIHVQSTVFWPNSKHIFQKMVSAPRYLE